jgi:hypothetical protein
MTLDDFRRIALSFPGAEELSGLGYANFRADRKSFATIEDSVAAISLTRDQQATFIATTPEVFAPVAGGWGRLGSTHVCFEKADEATVQQALDMAWGNVSSIAARAVKVAAALADIGAKAASVDAGEDVANVAVDIASLPDAVDPAEAAKVPDAVVAVDIADAAIAEPRDDLQSAIDRLQAFWEPVPGPGPAT